MREYKFRAWDETEKHMYNWGNLINQNLKNIFTITEQCGYILMQYTGLHDENGKEIYEGDIIEFSYDMFVGNFDTFAAKGKVVLEEGAFYVEVFENERTTKDEAYLLYSINLDTIEVIGNIYENKELLNETNR